LCACRFCINFPRVAVAIAVYAALLVGLMVSYVSYWPWRGDFRDLTVMFIALFSAGAFLFKAVKQYRGLDFMN